MKPCALIIEDNVILAEILNEFFDSNGWMTRIAQNGQVGLELSYWFSFKLVITDIDMPVINGLDFIKKFREFNSETPIAVISDRKKYDQSMLISIGANTFIEKPILNLEAALQKYTA